MAQILSKGVYEMKNIFDEMTLNQLKLKNRLFRSATWLALADDEGNLTEPIFDTLLKEESARLSRGLQLFHRMMLILKSAQIFPTINLLSNTKNLRI